MTDLRTAALRVLEAWQDQKGMKLLCEAMDDLGTALSQPEDKSQAAFEHWVETVEATQGCAISRNAVVDKLLTVTPAQMAHAEAVESFIQPEIKADKEARWLPMPWKGLTEEEHNYYKACGFVGVKAVEEKLRAKNSTLACIPPG
jgi:hypothetical protein